jgi:uncharacterized repeat protein (TIGR03847 family)
MTMASEEIDLKPVDFITTDAGGVPGKRVFYLQGIKGERQITLIVEKIQVQSLALGIEEFLAEIAAQYPNLPEASSDYVEENMHIQHPIDPLFRVRELSLGYNAEEDLIILSAQQLLPEDQDPEDGMIVRFWCSRSQIRALAYWGIEVAARGRPICLLCGQPMEPGERHLCPKKNGRPL